MKEMVMRYLAVGAAGSVGAIARFVIGAAFGRLNKVFPFGTFFINITGSLFLGWFLAHIATHRVSDTTRAAIAVGFVGAYTTFSTYMYESNQLIDDGAIIESVVNLLGSMIVGLLAVRVGIWLAKAA